MKLTLNRTHKLELVTLGELLLDGEHECFTLEDPIRQTKVYGDTCIWPGTYTVTINFSPRFKKDMMRVLDVQGFEGILIHSGNGPEDTKGCILVGDLISGERIAPGTSRTALVRLFSKVLTSLGKGEPVQLIINNPKEVES